MGALFDEETGNAEVTCDTCGKEITHSNEWGMFCEDNCGIEQAKAAAKQVQSLIAGIDKMFNGK